MEPVIDIPATDSIWLFLILAFLMTGAMLFVGVKVMEFLDKRQNRK